MNSAIRIIAANKVLFALNVITNSNFRVPPDAVLKASETIAKIERGEIKLPIYHSSSSPIFISNMASSITFTHSSVCFFMSFPQNRITVHPINNSFLFTSSSRSLFLDILLIQYSLLLLFSSLGLRTSQSLPWKILHHKKLLSYILSKQYPVFLEAPYNFSISIPSLP